MLIHAYNSPPSLFAVQVLEDTSECIFDYPLTNRVYYLYSLGLDLISLTRIITTLWSVKSLAEDGQSKVLPLRRS